MTTQYANFDAFHFTTQVHQLMHLIALLNIARAQSNVSIGTIV